MKMFSNRHFRELKPIIRYCASGTGVFGQLPHPKHQSYSGVIDSSSDDECRITNLINAYRRYGYQKAHLDPLGLSKISRVAELAPEFYKLTASGQISLKRNELCVSDLVERLELIYCGPISVEFMHINSVNERCWFGSSFENLFNMELNDDERLGIMKIMSRCQNFDEFLAKKFPTVKRYGCEGAEPMLVFINEVLNLSVLYGLEDLTICMAHRGRLNILCELLKFPSTQMFRKMRGQTEFPEGTRGVGDVLSHFRSSFDHVTDSGTVHVTMLPNSSHLEAVNPVAMGRTRGRSCTKRLGDYGSTSGKIGDGILCVQIHGDGAFTGQGVSWETVALSQLPHFRVGGSIHFVTNNQVAYTTEAFIGRSSAHCTDIAKAFDCPIIHVNADYPELVAKAARLAMNYRNQFRKDTFVNFICYRRWGHNELDDPRFTQPLMYRIIDERMSIPNKYVKSLVDEGLLTAELKDSLIEEHTETLLKELHAVETSLPEVNHLKGNWSGMVQAPNAVEKWDTGVNIDLLRYVGAKSVSLEETFNVNERLRKMHINARLKKMVTGIDIDWATAEALAFGSLLLQGFDVRISGQDVGRGTFSHRHAIFADQHSNELTIPLNNIYPGQRNFIEVANNMLSEEAILGFEFGFSIESPRRLCIWEAQFGDFSNGAQIIIDNFISSAEAKWLIQSGLVLILPHGFDGAGPEHSSARIERFLQLCDSREDQLPPDGEHVNIYVANPTTSAQYFHLLRRQVIAPYRKPLIVIGPKILLRHSMAASTLHDMTANTSFQTVIDDETVHTDNVTKIVFVTGKHSFNLVKERSERRIDNVAIVRLESLCPFPIQELHDVIARYQNAREFVWSQEEPRNAGAWSYVQPRFANALSVQLAYCGRPEIAWSATPIGCLHQQEHESVLVQTFAL